MTSKRRGKGLLVGAALMAAGAFGPWATMQLRVGGSASVGGVDHGGVEVVLMAALVAILVVLRVRSLAYVAGLATAAWFAYCAYVLPGSLTDGPAWMAELAWGAGVTALGALVVVTSAARAALGAVEAALREAAVARVVRGA